MGVAVDGATKTCVLLTTPVAGTAIRWAPSCGGRRFDSGRGLLTHRFFFFRLDFYSAHLQPDSVAPLEVWLAVLCEQQVYISQGGARDRPSLGLDHLFFDRMEYIFDDLQKQSL